MERRKDEVLYIFFGIGIGLQDILVEMKARLLI